MVFVWVSFSFGNVKISVVVPEGVLHWFRGVIKYSVGTIQANAHRMLYGFGMLCFFTY